MKIIAVIYATFAVATKILKKIQVCTGFEPLTSANITAMIFIHINPNVLSTG